MFTNRRLGRLAGFASVVVLLNACAVGEISSNQQETPRSGGQSATGPVLQCSDASPDVAARNGWRGSDASSPVDGALRFEVKTRPTAPNLDGLVAVGAESIDAHDKAVIAVRFAGDGLVDVLDGAYYASDMAYPYESGVWYSIGISADPDMQTYDVEIGPCGEPRETLIKGASFGGNAGVSRQLSTWAVWSSQTAALEVSTPAWIHSGGCEPATCASLGHECGQPGDGCGGTLDCGGCGSTELCASGLCVEESVPSLSGAPSDSDYDHVIELTGTNGGADVISAINALGPGSVLVRSAEGQTATLVSSGGKMTIPRADVVFYNLDIDGVYFSLNDGTGFWSVNADPVAFETGEGHDNWFIRDSYFSGGAGKLRSEGCVGNVYHQNQIGGLGLTRNWIIENSTIANYMDRESICTSDHSEALFIAGGAQDGIIRNNTFVGGGSTAFIFLNELGCSNPSTCYPRNNCIEGNTFNSPQENSYDIQFHPNLEPYVTTNAVNYIDPAQDVDMPGGSWSGWRQPCRND